MTEPISRSYLAEVTENLSAERAIVAKIGTGDLDRFMTVIDPAGMDLRGFRENPVVLWEHGKDPTRGRLPIGRNAWIKARKNGNGELLAKTQFAKDDYSQSLYEMYRDGMLRGWSIHAIPDAARCSPPTKDERRARPDLERCQMMFRGTELTEYSGTAVPGNAKALTMMEARGIWFPDEARSVEVERDAKKVIANGDGYEGRNEEDDDLTEDQRRYITHSGSEWIVHAEDGKVLGTHGSKAEAVAQLAAVEAHKHDKGRALPTLEGTIIDVAAIHRHGIALIDSHCRRRLDLITARLDLMRGRV